LIGTGAERNGGGCGNEEQTVAFMEAGVTDFLTIGLIPLSAPVMHEMGHLLGLEHDSETRDLMEPILGLSTRRTPTAADADLIDLLYYQMQEEQRG
jgi:hypothetical protein